MTEIDVQATPKKKRDVGVRRHVVFGLCKPPSAKQALQADPEIDLLLPCDVAAEGDQRLRRVIDGIACKEAV